MDSLIKKFKVKANENILLNKDVIKTIETNFGSSYSEALKNDKTFARYEVTILFNSDTTVKVKSYKDQEVEEQDIIDGVFMCFPNYITQVISTKDTSGTLLLRV